MTRVFFFPTWLASAALAIVLTASAGAVDGVVLINQDSVLAGGITPADAPGFPISITQPGSYRLSGNLTVPAGVNGIEISASHVTLDLNGFTIGGPTTTNSFYGISALNPQNDIAVRNGSVTGFLAGLSFAQVNFGIIEDLRLMSMGSGFTSNLTGRASILRRVTADNQVVVTCPSLVVDTVAGSFSSVGIGQRVYSNTLGVNF